MDRVNARLSRAAVSHLRATVGGGCLSWSIPNFIGAVAASIKGMEQMEPVANLVDSRSTQVVVLRGAPRDSLGLNDAAITGQKFGVFCTAGFRESAVAQRILALVQRSVDEVKVEVFVASPTKVLLHHVIPMAIRPVTVDGVVRIEVGEGDTVRLVGLVQILDLILDLLFLQGVSIFA